MNFIKFESAQKLRGGFYTEQSLAAFLVKWVKQIAPVSLLEPSCGDGAFLDAIKQESMLTLKKITACELDPIEAAKAARHSLKPRVLSQDFLRWYLFHARNGEQFDAVVGNPPFIRYQYLPKEQQLLAEKIFELLGLPFTKHTNAWVPFVLASMKLLRPGGRLAMVIPSEIFHIPHAQSLRRYLAEQCSHILILDPQEIWFGETLQGTVLLLAQKKRDPTKKGKGVGIISVVDRKILASNPETLFRSAAYANGTTIEGKWMPIFLTTKERCLIAELREREDIKLFGDVASVDVGIVTGANKFFLVDDKTVDEFELQKWAHPMFGRSEHVSGLIYSAQDHRLNQRNGLPGNFLWFNKDDRNPLPSNVRRYLDLGLSDSLHTRFKCRTRKVWYQVPSVYVAPIAMLKRAHHYPRLVLNTAQAYTTDTAYRIVPRRITAESLVFGFVNSLTCLCAEMEGRHYGGGVLELVPSEIERLLVPVVKVTKQELSRADHQFRHAPDRLSFLSSQDRAVFRKMGLSLDEQEVLNSAWARLRDRRHRVPAREVDRAVA